jgi:NAD(P)-dependent dehydrogenase (short-subunit alcohol dehydrogenase family)
MANKVAFVTGASRVTGKGIALELAKAGYDVGLTYTGYKEVADDTVRQIEAMGHRAKAYHADIEHVDETRATLEQFFEEFGHVDVFVNNTGLTRYVDYLTVTEEVFNRSIHVNIRGTYFCGQAAARDMIAKGVKGVIVNISSFQAVGTWPGATIYATTKAAICKMTQAQALDLSGHGIRVVCVAPGYVDVGWQNRSKEDYARYEVMLTRLPLPRFATAEEIGHAVTFLSSEKAAYVTGTTLFVEGGGLLPVVAENPYV